MEEEFLLQELDTLNYEQLGTVIKNEKPKSYSKNIIINNIFGLKKNEKKEYINTDIFYSDIYDYYYKGGYVNILVSNITEILSLLFGIIFIVFIFAFLDWGKILNCGLETLDCGELYLYITPRIPNFFLILVIVFSLIFTTCKIVIFIFSLKNLRKTRMFYKDVLNISQEELQTISWYKIVNDLTKIENNNLSSSDITNKILKKENFYIALLNKNIINMPCVNLYTRQLDFNIQKIIPIDTVNLDHTTIRNKFIIYGVINAVLSLFIFIYIFTYFFTTNIDNFYSNKVVLGSRRYSILAKWKFREYNELKHFFEKRINKSVQFGNEYIQNFQSPIIEILSKFICLICGAFIGFFIVISVLDESILLYVRLFDRSLIFYTGVIGAISAGARGFIRAPENSIYNPESIMKKIHKHTHYMPSTWINKTHTFQIRNEFMQLFPLLLKRKNLFKRLEYN